MPILKPKGRFLFNYRFDAVFRGEQLIMKKYIVDQLSLPIAAFLSFLVSVLCIHRGAVYVVTAVFLILSCVLCYRVLVLPLDLICGKQKACVQFSRQYVSAKYHTEPKLVVCTWCFHDLNKKIDLINPYLTQPMASDDVRFPPKDKEIIIYYYKYSKLFCFWEPIDEKPSNPC